TFQIQCLYECIFSANAIGFFARCPTELFARLPNSNIYLKLHSILTLLFKSLRLLEFIFEAIFYIERVKFLSSHSIQHYFSIDIDMDVIFKLWLGSDYSSQSSGYGLVFLIVGKSG
ncbi:unnamed protein product, partial [Rotaria magnacalcarata]